MASPCQESSHFRIPCTQLCRRESQRMPSRRPWLWPSVPRNERQAHRSLPWLWDGVSAEALCTTDGPRHGSPTWLWDYKPYHNNITSYFAIKHGITRTILHTACHVFKDSKNFPWAFHQNSSKEMHLSYLSYPQSHIPQHKGVNTLWRVEKWTILMTYFLRLKDAQRATRALDLS